MMEQMQAHMQMMEGTSGQATMQMMSQHRPMLPNMISQMSREMRDMNMTAYEEWNSTIEALRQDLVRMPVMSAAEMDPHVLVLPVLYYWFHSEPATPEAT